MSWIGYFVESDIYESVHPTYSEYISRVLSWNSGLLLLTQRVDQVARDTM